MVSVMSSKASSAYESNGVSPKTLECVFDAALMQIMTKGLERLSLRDIATECHLDIVKLQTVFPSNKAVIEANIHWYFMKYGQQMRSTIDMHDDPFNALKFALFEFIELSIDRKRQGRMLFRPIILDLCCLNNDLRSNFISHNEIWINLVRDKLKSSKIDPDKVEEIAYYYGAVLVGLYEMVKLDVSEETILAAAQISLEPLKTAMQGAEHTDVHA